MTTSMNFIYNVVSSAFMIVFPYMVVGQFNTVSAGRDYSSSTGSVSFTIGQVFDEQVSNGIIFITQGVQQPYEIYTASQSDLADDYGIKVYPNPTCNELFVSSDLKNNEILDFKLIDLNGKIVIVSNSFISSKIDLSTIVSGSYFLSINSNGNQIITFKIIKQ